MTNSAKVIRTSKDRVGSIRVFLDDGRELHLNANAAADSGLKKGNVLSDTEPGELHQADLFYRSLKYALNFLIPRARSEAEMRTRLLRRGFNSDVVEQVLIRLKEQGLVNDFAFAQQWCENRDNFKPLSSRLMRLELKQKGIDADIVDGVTANMNDEVAAHRAAQKKARSLTGLDYTEFRRRLWSFLRQRGFDWELSKRIIDIAWEQSGNKQAD